MKRVFSLILALILCLSLYACGQPAADTPTTEPTVIPTQPTEEPTQEPTIDPEELAAQEAAIFHDQMAIVLDAETRTDPVIDYKAVAFRVEDNETGAGSYSKNYVPEELLTDNPHEVHYIIRYREFEEKVGLYMGAGTNGSTAYRRHIAVEIFNLLTDERVDHKDFVGGEPPQTVEAGTNGYGSYPDETKITNWVLSVIQEDSVTYSDAALKYLNNIRELLGNPSRKELIEKLCKDYALPDATYAVDSIDINWNEHALSAAKIMLSGSDYTAEELMERLTQMRGFTEEEAQYAIDHCGKSFS